MFVDLLQCFDLRFQRCCEKGYRGAVQLAAFCSGHSEATVKAAYEKWCQNLPASNGSFEDDLPEAERLEQQGLDVPLPTDDAEDNECHKVLDTLQREAPWVDPEEGGDEAQKHEGPAPELAFQKVSDQEDWSRLLETTSQQADEREPGGEKIRLPTTLLEAMNMPGDRFSALFRLSVRLRTFKGGVDTRWVPNARKARRTSHKLNSFQYLGY